MSATVHRTYIGKTTPTIEDSTYEEFMEHAYATDSVVEYHDGVFKAVGDYCGKECLIAEFDENTSVLTLHCV